MIFIFGIDSIKKEIGPVEEKLCPHCSNKKHWLLQKSSRMFSLFFIPLIPFSTKYYIHCPICNYGFDVKDDELQKKRSLAQLNMEALNNDLSEKDYEEKLNKL